MPNQEFLNILDTPFLSNKIRAISTVNPGSIVNTSLKAGHLFQQIPSSPGHTMSNEYDHDVGDYFISSLENRFATSEAEPPNAPLGLDLGMFTPESDMPPGLNLDIFRTESAETNPFTLVDNSSTTISQPVYSHQLGLEIPTLLTAPMVNAQENSHRYRPLVNLTGRANANVSNQSSFDKILFTLQSAYEYIT